MTESQPDGAAVLAAFAGATEHLQEQAGAIDAINVYPVPDGDTGSNMAATMREALAHASMVPEKHAADALARLARGALYGARGNSGVILSQALRGLAAGSAGAPTIDAAVLARALRQAETAAYAAVSHPVEGTMLTVLRAAAAGAEAHAHSLPGAGAERGCFATLAAAISAAEAAEALTPEQLPALREAGVTDSGGEGICVLLRGLYAALSGTRPAPATVGAYPLATLAGHAEEEYGFCTEFVVEPLGRPLDVGAVRAAVDVPGNRSVLVVGDATALHVHVHTGDADGLLATIATLGRVSRTKVDDMTAQHRQFRAQRGGTAPALACLAMSPGPGFDAVFESLGVATAPLVEVVKPAAGAIAAAADALGSATVILLPNHRNVVMAALQAVSLARTRLLIVPTRSLPQGIAAAVAFNPDADPSELCADMEEAMGDVVTVEVTVAATDRTAEGILVKAGDAIALINGRLVLRAGSPVDALISALLRVAEGSSSLITIYGGAAIDEDGLAAAAATVRARLRGCTVEVVAGGQALYPFIASVER